MSDNFELPTQELPKEAPQTGQYLKNLKELKIGNGAFSVSSDGKMEIRNETGSGIIIDTTGIVQFTYNGIEYASERVDSSTNLILESNENFQFFDASSNQLAVLSSTGLKLLGGTKYEFNGSSAYFKQTEIKFNGGALITDGGATIDLDRTITVAGDVSLSTGKKFQIGTTPGVTFSSGNVGGLFEMNAVGGIITYWNKF